MSKVALVTGGSSGIGRACAAALAGAGYEVYECSRHAPKENMPGVAHLTADVTREEDVKAAVEEIEREAGRLDLLVCCAGFGISGALEFTDPADSHALLETNLFGADNCVRAALAVMRKQQKGRVIFISSVASVVPIPFQGWYSAAKAAMNAYARALAAEVRPFGITVCSVLPGDVKTGFTAARKKEHAGDDVYGGRIARSVAVMERDEKTGMPPGRIARAVVHCANARRVKPCRSVGLQYRFFCVLAKFLPEALCARIVERIYAK